jgi:hypothetical protein
MPERKRQGRRGRPGGNPEITKYSWTTDRPEPLYGQCNVRIPKSMEAIIKAKPNWQEFVRQAITEKLEREAGQDHKASEEAS